MATVDDACDEELLLALIDGRLAADEQGRVEAHLDGCEACRQTMIFALRERDYSARASESSFGGSADEPGETPLPASAGRYLVLGTLGAGGMGTVCVALDPRLDRPVAIKFLHPPRSTGALETRARALRREGRVMATLRHPNVVEVYDIGDLDTERPFVAMALIDGVSMARWAAEASPAFGARLDVLMQAGRGLAAAHAVGVVHRDFKPSNVMVTTEQQAIIVDFGLGGWLDGSTLRDDSSSREESSASVRGGTPRYMAPEQRRGAPVDARADQFSFCATAWRVLGGWDVDIGEGTAIPHRIATVLRRGLSPRPNDRYPDMSALLVALERAVHPPTFRRAVAAVGLLGGATWLLSPRAEVFCVDEADRALARWNLAERDHMRESFEAAAPELGAEAWAATAPLVTDFIAVWSTQYREACRLEHDDPGTFDDTIACLRRADASLQAALDAFDAPDGEVVENATQLVANLPSPRQCLDPQARGLSLPTPSVGLQGRLARLETRVLSGEDITVAEDLDALASDARALRDQGTLIATLVLLGRVNRAMSEYDAAEAAWEEAIWTAVEFEANATVVDAATEAEDLCLVRGRGIERAESWLELARAAARRSESDSATMAQLATGESTFARATGDLDGAATWAEEALRARTEALGRAHPRVLEDRLRLALALSATDRTSEAVELAEAARAQAAQIFGPDHPRVADVLATLSHAQLVDGNYEGALAAAEEALRITIASRGDAHAQTADHHRRVAETQWQLGQVEPAREHFDAALRIYRLLHGNDHQNVATTLGSLAMLDFREGNNEAALAEYDEAIDIFTQNLGEGDDAVGMMRSFRARVLAALGRLDDALIEATAAVDVLTRRLGRDRWETANCLNVLGEVAARAGDIDAADRAYAESNRIYVAVFGESHPTTTTARVTYVHFLLEQGKADRALVEADAIVAALADRSVESAFLADATFARAMTLDALGRTHEARRAAEDALALYRSSAQPDTTAIDYVEGWLGERAP